MREFRVVFMKRYFCLIGLRRVAALKLHVSVFAASIYKISSSAERARASSHNARACACEAMWRASRANNIAICMSAQHCCRRAAVASHMAMTMGRRY